MSKAQERIFKGLEHIYYFGPYTLTMQLSYEPDLDSNIEEDWKEDDLKGAKINLEKIIKIIFDNRIKSFFTDVLGVKQDRPGKDKVAEERKDKKTKIYTITELSEEVMGDLLNKE